MQKRSATGNRTPVSRVTGGDTSHYTIADLLSMRKNLIKTPNVLKKAVQCYVPTDMYITDLHTLSELNTPAIVTMLRTPGLWAETERGGYLC